MRVQLIIRPEAERDLIEARDWYDAHRAGLGAEFLTAAESGFNRIAEFPESYAIGYRKVRLAGLHGFPYIIYYRLTCEVAEVLAVLHGSRDPRIWRSRA